MPRVTRRVLVTGIVQGVGYRDFARRAALALGLVGWVRNLRDGRVEALVEGEEDRVESFVARCRAGPALSRVTGVSAEAVAAAPSRGFEVRPSA